VIRRRLVGRRRGDRPATGAAVPPGARVRLLQASLWFLSLVGAVVGGVGAEVIGLLPMLDLAAVLTMLEA